MEIDCNGCRQSDGRGPCAQCKTNDYCSNCGRCFNTNCPSQARDRSTQKKRPHSELDDGTGGGSGPGEEGEQHLSITSTAFRRDPDPQKRPKIEGEANLARGLANTLRRPGFRFGVATWNLHGLSLSKDESLQEAQDFQGCLDTLAQLEKYAEDFKKSLKDTTFTDSDEDKKVKKKYSKLIELYEKEYTSDYRLPYMRLLIRRYESLAGKTNLFRAPSVAMEEDSSQKILYDRISETLELIQEGKYTQRGKKKGSYKAKKTDPVSLVIRRLLRCVACKAILLLFEKHAWLDVLVLQEVKYNGIKLLESLVREHLDVYRGPKIVSFSYNIKGKKKGEKRYSEVEYYPIVLRKGGVSNNCIEEAGYKLELKKVWWLDPATETPTELTLSAPDPPAEAPTDGEEAKQIAKPDNSEEGKDNFDEEDDSDEEEGDAEGENPGCFAPGDLPDVEWNKREDKFRPVVVYDLQFIGAQGGLGSTVHVGVVHTTPGSRVSELPEQEKSSLTALGSSRKKDVQSGEFQRHHQYSQLKSLFQEVNQKAYGNDERYKGPWVLAGDYYLFEESRVVDLSVTYVKDKDRDGTFGSRDTLLRAEFAARLELYGGCACWKTSFEQKQLEWKNYCTEYGRLCKSETGFNGKDRGKLIERLEDDSRQLLRILSEGTSTPTIRELIQSRQSYWLDPEPWLMSLLGNTALNPDDLVFADLTLLDLASQRMETYRKLVEKCSFYAARYESLVKGEQDGPILEIFNALRADNEQISKESRTSDKELREQYRTTRDDDGDEQQDADEGEATEVKTKRRDRHPFKIDFSAEYDPMRSALGTTMGKQLPENLQLAQTPMGTNLDSYKGLSMLGGEPDDEKKREQWRRQRSQLNVRLKIADFLIHTRSNPTTGDGTGHWANRSIGMLSPDVGKIVPVDTENLSISAFWAAFADHFPVGGLLSTSTEPTEEQALRRQLFRPSVDDEERAAKELSILQTSRLLHRAKRMQALAMLLVKPDNEDQDLVFNVNAFTAMSVERRAEDTDGEYSSRLFAIISALQKLLNIPDEERFQGGLGFVTLEDVGLEGPLDLEQALAPARQ